MIEKVEVQQPTVTVPGTALEFALPTPEVVTVAATTAAAAAAASVGATLAAQNLVKVLKPMFQTALKKLAKLRGKDPETFGRRRLVTSEQRVEPSVESGCSMKPVLYSSAHTRPGQGGNRVSPFLLLLLCCQLSPHHGLAHFGD